MNRHKLSRAAALFVAAAFAVFSFACTTPQPNAKAGNANTTGARADKKTGTVRIGLSMDTLKEERWQRDRDLFVARAKELGAEVLVQSANGDDRVQTQQADNLLTQGIDALVVIPHNGEIAASIVEAAKAKGVPVVSYDRLIRNSEPDLYISFDNERVGELQARYLFDRAPKGNYILVGGAPTDNNAQLLRKGQLKVLKGAIDSGDIKVLTDQFAKDWLASEALRITEDALTKSAGDVVAVVASNDSTAGGAISALEVKNLTGKVLVSGQDADLAALQRIVAGKQTMTVYKPVHLLAQKAAEAAVALARGEKPDAPARINNGKIDVPSILLEPVPVDKNNIMETVVKDGYQKLDAIYEAVPADQRPKPPTP
ncbi:MAG TPA: D-xylose ABC transporter substrate-binding protein [Pyrinomonadaceae bacterium]|jgi:D-xylose transport system substrate-binding protein|nr:D-xylose ABC transporter substrate-binding protein [Pyrinomonadaceae bacterium]